MFAQTGAADKLSARPSPDPPGWPGQGPILMQAPPRLAMTDASARVGQEALPEAGLWI